MGARAGRPGCGPRLGPQRRGDRASVLVSRSLSFPAREMEVRKASPSGEAHDGGGAGTVLGAASAGEGAAGASSPQYHGRTAPQGSFL